MKAVYYSGWLCWALSLTNCAVLHHAQLSDIDNRYPKLVPFEIMVSEYGVNLEEAGRIAKAISRSEKGHKAIDEIRQVISLFQMGPRTGNPVYSIENYNKVVSLLVEQCPSGRITGLLSIREMRKYPVISGEIVKIKGFCIGQRG